MLEDPKVTVLLVGSATALLLYYMLRTKANKYPPGPLAFPVVGNLPQLARAGSLTAFANYYRKIYGDAFTFTFGHKIRIIISGYDVIKDLMVKNADFTSNRSPHLLSKYAQDIIKKTPGLFWAPHPHWKTLRSFAISSLREDGMGKASMEPEILEEIDCYISTFIEPNVDKPIRMKRGLSQATCNIVSQLLFGKRKDYKDVKFNRMMHAIDESVEISTKLAIASSLPAFIGNLLMKSPLQRDKTLTDDIVIPTLQSYIDEHKVDLDRENPRDLTDRFLIHSAKESTEPCFSDENCRIFELHLYVAGTDTTSTALTWGLLFMCLHPEKQERVQQEIDEKIGRDRPASCKDRAEMPYTDAVLLETLRCGNIAPTALPHTLEKEMVVDGKVLPAGVELTMNMSSVLNDETVFEEPDKFKPERYLTGDIALKKQRTIPFGIGRRACLGESLAKMELFHFFTTFLQKYRVRLPEGSTATTESVERLIRSPKPYDIIFTCR